MAHQRRRDGVFGLPAVRSVLLTIAALIPAVALAQPSEEVLPISVSAVDQEWEGDIWRGVGQVLITYQDIKIQCDEMEVNQQTMELVARGNVVLDQGPRRLAADELRYNLRTKTGVFVNAAADMPPYYHFSGARVEKLDETHYLLEGATFSTCDQEDRPPWQFRARRAKIEEDGYGRFWGTAVVAKGVPVFYLPYLLWPVKRDRAAGLLSPGFGYSERRGVYLGLAHFAPLGRSFDTTVALDLWSEGYVGVGSEWRWAPWPATDGQINLYAIRDKDTGDIEWKVRGLHTQNDFFGFRLLAEVDQLSDIDFFQEFERSFDRSTLRSLYSYIYLTRSWGPYALNMRADYRETFFGTSDSAIVLSQLPEVEMRVRPTRLGRTTLYWSMLSSFNLFDVDRGNTIAGSYARADLYPQLSYTLPGPPWLTVTPRLGGRSTYYTAQYGRNELNQTVLEDEPLVRAFLAGGVDIVGPSVSRIFNRPLGPFEKLKHVIEPRLSYAYVSDVDAETLASVPRFDEVDSTPAFNKLRAALFNRLFVRTKGNRSARELGFLELYQEHSFSEPLNFSSDRTVTSQRGPLGANLRLTPTSTTGFDVRAQYDTLFNGLRSSSLSASVAPGSTRTVLTWYQSFSPQTGDRTSSQIRTLFGYHNPEFPLSFDVHVAYDIEQRELQQQRLKMYYQGSCWGVEVEYRDLRIGAYPSKDYRIVLDFRGLGRLLDITGGFGDSTVN